MAIRFNLIGAPFNNCAIVAWRKNGVILLVGVRYTRSVFVSFIWNWVKSGFITPISETQDPEP
jgi:hypothetical protein